MKYGKTLFRLLTVSVVLFSADPTYQSIEQTHQPYVATDYCSKNQCAQWAFKRRVQVSKPVSDRRGNAKNWYYNAYRPEYATGHTPRKLTIIRSAARYYRYVTIVE